MKLLRVSYEPESLPNRVTKLSTNFLGQKYPYFSLSQLHTRLHLSIAHFSIIEVTRM